MQISNVFVRLLIALLGTGLILVLGGIGLVIYVFLYVSAHMWFAPHTYSDGIGYDPFNAIAIQMIAIIALALALCISARYLDSAFIQNILDWHRAITVFPTAFTDPILLADNHDTNAKVLRNAAAFLSVGVIYPFLMAFLKKPDVSNWLADLSKLKYAWMFLVIFILSSYLYVWTFRDGVGLNEIYQWRRKDRHFFSYYIAPWTLLPMLEVLLLCFYEKLAPTDR